jgi:hypothetical protein
MEREGMLVKERSKQKALILVYRELPSEVQVCQQVKAPKEAGQGESHSLPDPVPITPVV